MSGKQWSMEEETFLRLNYATMTRSQLVEALGRTRLSVEGKLAAMGLRKDFEIKQSICAGCGNNYAHLCPLVGHKEDADIAIPHKISARNTDGSRGSMTVYKVMECRYFANRKGRAPLGRPLYDPAEIVHEGLLKVLVSR